jgi:putative endopeptidase
MGGFGDHVRATALAALMLLSALPAQAEPPFFPPYGIDLSAQDKSVRPGDDFYQYANGGWLARTPIPPDEAGIGGLRDVAIRVESRLHDLVEDAAKAGGEQPSDTDGKIGAMYAAFMDERRIEALGMVPIRAQIDAVNTARDKEAIAGLMGRAPYDFGEAVFAVRIRVDRKDPTHYAVYLGQDGLGMPDRDYYLKPEFAAQLAAYKTYVERLLSLVGWKDPASAADAVVALETQIAEVSWTKAEQRDPPKLYNPMSPAELAAFAPGFPWKAFLTSAQVGDKGRLIVGEKSAFPKIAAIYAAAPIDTLKAALAFSIADRAAPYLSTPFQQARFAFRDHALSGQSEMKARWRRAVAAVSGGDCLNAAACFGTLNWAVGQLYVRHDFTPETKAKMERLVGELLAAYHARLEKVDWMSPATKQEALKKLDTYTVKVGYPDHPRDYSNVVIRRDDLVGDVRRAAAADWDFFVKRSESPVDRAEWYMTPQTVDAYNGPLRDVVFPAAFLQPPYFDPNADDAINYGSVGAAIGHELTHGFDDQGRKTDAAGVLRDWWAPADDAAFKARAAVLGAQFAKFEPVSGMHINPDLTMGENIADLGGVVIALDAYHGSLGGKPAPIIDGTTGDQRFFMAWAQIWRGKATDDALRQQIASNPHSWNRFRVLGPLPNVDAWYAAFDVQPGDKLYRPPETRARIW